MRSNFSSGSDHGERRYHFARPRLGRKPSSKQGSSCSSKKINSFFDKWEGLGVLIDAYRKEELKTSSLIEVTEEGTGDLVDGQG